MTLARTALALRLGAVVVACGPAVVALGLGPRTAHTALTALLGSFAPAGVAAVVLLVAPVWLGVTAWWAGTRPGAAWVFVGGCATTVVAGVLLTARYGHLVTAPAAVALGVAGLVLAVAAAATAATSS
ncbi:MAG TPA: hypothetical protein VGE77_02400 [Nocardioides sp.]